MSFSVQAGGQTFQSSTFKPGTRALGASQEQNNSSVDQVLLNTRAEEPAIDMRQALKNFANSGGEFWEDSSAMSFCTQPQVGLEEAIKGVSNDHSAPVAGVKAGDDVCLSLIDNLGEEAALALNAMHGDGNVGGLSRPIDAMVGQHLFQAGAINNPTQQYMRSRDLETTSGPAWGRTADALEQFSGANLSEPQKLNLFYQMMDSASH